MKLQKHEVNAIVDTLQKEHNKKWKAFEQDLDGVNAEEKAMLVAKNKRIRKEIQSLSLETKIEMQDSSDWFQGIRSNSKIPMLCSESDTYDMLVEHYVYERNKKGNNQIHRFDRKEIERQVVMASIDSADIAEIMKKIVMKAPPERKSTKPKAKKKKIILPSVNINI